MASVQQRRTAFPLEEPVVLDGDIRRRMKRLEHESCRRYQWKNGDGLLAIGMTLALFGVIAMTMSSLSLPWFAVLVVALLVGGAGGALLLNVVREKMVLPSGMCLLSDSADDDMNESSPTIIGIAAAVLYSVVAALAVFLAGPSTIAVLVGTACALLAVSIGIKTGNIDLVVLSALLQAAPLLFNLLFDITDLDILWRIAAYITADGLVLSTAGAIMLRRSYARGTQERDTAELAYILSSGDAHERFLAAGFLIRYIEPLLIKEIIAATDDEDVAVAYTAQLALAHIWGPSAEDMLGWFSNGGRLSGVINQLPVALMQVIQLEKSQWETASLDHQHEVEAEVKRAVEERPELLDRLIMLSSAPKSVDADTLSAPDRDVDKTAAGVGDTDIDADKGVVSKGAYLEETRLVALELLGATQHPQAYVVLLKRLLSSNRKTVQAAMVGFSGAQASAIIYLESLFDSTAAWIRKRGIMASTSLLEKLSKRDIDEMRVAYALLREKANRLVKHKDPVTRSLSLELLSFERDENIEILKEACEDRHGLVRGSALRLLIKARPGEAKRFVMKGLQDARAHVRLTAIEGVVSLKLSQAHPHIIQMITDSNPLVARAASEASFIAQVWAGH